MSMTSSSGVTGASGSPDPIDHGESAPAGVPGPARFSGRELRQLVADGDGRVATSVISYV